MKRRVLIAEDNVGSAEAMAQSLRRYGHDVYLACEGHSAVELACRVRPDLLFLDVGLPGLNGFEVAKSLRREHGFDSALIIAVAGEPQDEVRQQALEAGCDQYMVKPVNSKFLQSLLGKRP